MMPNEIVHDNFLPDGEAPPLGNRPVRRSRKRLLPLFLLLLGVVILVGGGIGLVSLLNAHQPTASGITAQQLRALEIHALQQANNYWLGLGCITRQDVTNNMQRDVGDAAYMDSEFTDAFR